MNILLRLSLRTKLIKVIVTKLLLLNLELYSFYRSILFAKFSDTSLAKA